MSFIKSYEDATRENTDDTKGCFSDNGTLRKPKCVDDDGDDDGDDDVLSLFASGMLDDALAEDEHVRGAVAVAAAVAS